MNFKKIMLLAQKIQEWYDDYVDEYFSDISRYGHLFSRHINVDKDTLIRRITRDRLVFSSTFIGLTEQEILKMCLDGLHKEKEAVSLFLADRDDDGDLKVWVETGKKIGIAYMKDPQKHDWSQGPKECRDFIIALKHRREDNGFFITTVYPICDEFDNWE